MADKELEASTSKAKEVEATEKDEKDVLEKLMGSMKYYQWVVTLSCFLVEIPLGWHLLSHSIMVPETTPIYCNNTNETIKDVMTAQERRSLYTEACHKKCPQVIVSDKYYDLTIVHQFELYCNGRESLAAVAQMVVMLGVLMGNFVFGLLADLFGRKLALIIACLAETPLGIAVAFSPNIYCFLVFKFILNIFVGGTMVTGFVLFTEIIGKKWRPICGLFTLIPFALGHLSLAGFAYIFRDWRWFQLTISLPEIIFIYYVWVLPESPRWLLAVGKTEKCIKTVEFIARKNGLPTNEVREQILKDLETKVIENKITQERGSGRDLFKTCRMAEITTYLWINWFSIICCYYGLAEYAASLGTNFYVSTALSALIQQPSLWFLFYTINFWGRNKSLLFSNSLATFALLCIYFIPEGDWQVVPACVGMFALGMSVPAIYVYSCEMFPTPLRNRGMGYSSALARLGAMMAAYVTNLRKIAESLPTVLLSSLMAISTITIVFLPETKGIVLPNTVEETENLKSLRPKYICKYISKCCSRARQKLPRANK